MFVPLCWDFWRTFFSSLLSCYPVMCTDLCQINNYEGSKQILQWLKYRMLITKCRTLHDESSYKRLCHLVGCYVRDRYKIFLHWDPSISTSFIFIKVFTYFLPPSYHLSCNPLCFSITVEVKKVIHELKLLGWRVLNYDTHCRVSLWIGGGLHIHHSLCHHHHYCCHFCSAALGWNVVLPF